MISAWRGMFTGIIEDVGSIAGIRKFPGRWEFVVRTGLDYGEIREGDSIAVDGVCLTAVRVEEDTFAADASLETLTVTTLRDKTAHDLVNLERAMRADSRFGGHMVMGHVDAIGRVVEIRESGDSIRMEIEIPKEISSYVVKKGSVAVDGISLTVNDRRDNRFALNVIPFSSSKTTIGNKKTGDQVNVETDIMARYVESLLKVGDDHGLDLQFLYRYGYIKGR
jgi:riboflavin synthase